MTAAIDMTSHMSIQERRILYMDLVQTVRNCNDRGMYYSAKWYLFPGKRVDGRAAEALNSMDEDVIAEGVVDERRGTKGLSVEEKQREARDLPKYLLGKSYFDCKEYARAAHLLKGCQSMKSNFLRLYSKYLVLPIVSHLTIDRRKTKRRGRRGSLG